MPVLTEPYFYWFVMQLVCFSPNQGEKKSFPFSLTSLSENLQTCASHWLELKWIQLPEEKVSLPNQAALDSSAPTTWRNQKFINQYSGIVSSSCSCSESVSVEVILVLPSTVPRGFSVFHVFARFISGTIVSKSASTVQTFLVKQMKSKLWCGNDN